MAETKKRTPVIGRVPTGSNERAQFDAAVKESIEILLGQRGNAGSKAVTFADLDQRARVIQQAAAQQAVIQIISSSFSPPAQDFSSPPAPTGLTASAALNTIIVQWNAATYTNHGFTEIWSNTTDNLGTAVQIGQSRSQFFGHAVGLTNQPRYYWIRHVKSVTDLDGTHTDVTGPFNAVPGVTATTGRIGTTDLVDNIITAQKIANGEVTPVKFSSGTYPTFIGSGLPSLPNSTYPAGTLFILTSDNKVYRSTGSAWVKTVDGGDVIAGTVAAGALITNTITAASGVIANAAILNAMIASVNADKIVAASLSAITANIGTATAGRLQNGANTTYFDLDATGSQTAFQIAGGALKALANGTLSVTALNFIDAAQLTSVVQSSINSSFYCDFSDVSGWVGYPGQDTGTFSAVAVSDSFFGGSVGRATGQVYKIWGRAIPFDPSVLYRISFRVRQVSNPSSGTKLIYAGIFAYANDTDAITANLTAAWFAANGQSLTAGGALTTYVGYVKARSGTAVIPANDPSSPSVLGDATIRFIRPAFAINIGDTAGNGVAEVDQLTVEAIANPDDWINTSQVKADAITSKVAANSATSVTLSDGAETEILSLPSLTTQGGPVLVTFSIYVYIEGNFSTGDVDTLSVFRIYRDSTFIGQSISVKNKFTTSSSDTPTFHAPLTITFLDQPSAGTYVYKLKSLSSTNDGGGLQRAEVCQGQAVELRR